MLHVQGRISVLGGVSAEISGRDREYFGDLPQGSGEISFRILPSLWCSGRVDLNWDVYGLLRDMSGGEFVLFKMTVRALIVLLGREGLTGT